MKDSEALRLYRAGNDAGAGYSPYTDVAGDDTIDSAVIAAEADGWERVLDRTTSDAVVVLRDADGDLLAIGGGAMGRGAWAVVISEEAVELAKVDPSQGVRS